MMDMRWTLDQLRKHPKRLELLGLKPHRKPGELPVETKKVKAARDSKKVELPGATAPHK